MLVLHKVQIDVTGPPEQNRDVSRFDCQSIGLLKTNYVILILATCSPIGRQRVSISSLCPRQREQFSNKRFTSCRTENQRPRAHDTKRRSKRTDTNYTLHTMRTRTRNWQQIMVLCPVPIVHHQLKNNQLASLISYLEVCLLLLLPTFTFDMFLL